MKVIDEMLPIMLPWIIMGICATLSLVDKANEGNSPSGPVTRIARGQGDVIYNLKNIVSGVVLMFKSTLSGLKEDSSRLVDKLAIRLINVLDKLRGDYDYGQKEEEAK